MKLHEWQAQQRESLAGYKQRACTGKLCYFSRTDVLVAADRMRELKNKHLMVYRCDECDGWHLGHKPYAVPVYPPSIKLPCGLRLVEWLRACL